MRFHVTTAILTCLLILLTASSTVAKVQSNYQRVDQNMTLSVYAGQIEDTTNMLGKRFVTTADATTSSRSSDPILALVIFVALSSLMF